MIIANKNTMRLGVMRTPRRRLLHVLNSNVIDTLPVLALEILQLMPEYGHTVVTSAKPATLDGYWMMGVQATGAELLHMDDCSAMDTSQYAAVINYDCDDWHSDVPTVHYAYTVAPLYTPDFILIPHKCYLQGAVGGINVAVMSPAIRSRVYWQNRRNNKDKHKTFTVGIFSSGRKDKYPAALIEYMKKHLPDDIRLIYTKQDVDFDIDVKDNDNVPFNRGESRPNIFHVPVILEAPLKMLQLCDVLVYAHDPGYMSPFGRLGVELMASGTPVICERQGWLGYALLDNTHVVHFDNKDPEAALFAINKLRQDTRWMERLGANARLWASWHDITVHLGTLKAVLRGLGA